jgi:hypothetical protein
MPTLYLCNVSDDVVERLEKLAERQGMSVSALALRELSEASRRAHSPRLLAELPDHGVPTSTLVEGLDADR